MKRTVQEALRGELAAAEKAVEVAVARRTIRRERLRLADVALNDAEKELDGAGRRCSRARAALEALTGEKIPDLVTPALVLDPDDPETPLTEKGVDLDPAAPAPVEALPVPVAKGRKG